MFSPRKGCDFARHPRAPKKDVFAGISLHSLHVTKPETLCSGFQIFA
jgi:hypothetical protein